MPIGEWNVYFEAKFGSPPRPLLVELLDRITPISSGAVAIDIGAGAGSDTAELLKRGFTVVAIDREPAALEHVQRAIRPQDRLRLQTQLAAFDEMVLPTADLVLAGYSLPFCNPSAYPDVWKRITTALHPDGYFIGEFFGPHDTWARNPSLTIHTADQVQELFTGFDIEVMQEEDADGVAVNGPKHWHVFHVIARKQ